MFMFLSVEQDVNDETRGFVMMYLDMLDYKDMVREHIIKSDITGHLFIADSTPLINFAKNALGVGVKLVSDRIEELSQQESQLLQRQLSMIPLFAGRSAAYFGKIALEPSDNITYGELEASVVSKFSGDDNYEDESDFSDEEPAVFDGNRTVADDGRIEMREDDYNIVKILSRNINIIKSLLERFNPEDCSIVIFNHDYYFIYWFNTVEQLEAFEYITSEFALEPFYGSEDYLAEHGFLLEGPDVLKIFV